MPPKAKKLCITDNLSLTCEWRDCQEVYQNMDSFLKHISEHINSSMLPHNPPGGSMDLVCHWRDCGHQSRGDYIELVRHIYFHAFHMKIKCYGANMIEQAGLKGCMLDGHSRNMIPELPERLQCGWNQCESIYYDNPEIFYRHVNIHPTMEPDGNFPPGGCKCLWEGCNITVKNRYKLKEHLRSHTQEKVIACPTCGGLFSSNTRFLDHIKRQAYIEDLRYQCSHCNKRFSTERLLRDHMRQHVNHYKCPLCDMTCPNPSGLRSHFKYRHTTETPYKCSYCEYGCKSTSDLRRHIESHNETPQYSCQVESCDFMSRSFQSYSTHFKKVHQGLHMAKYVCHICNLMFTRGGTLTMHLKKKHKFKWPSGHARFRYKLHDDGFYRLQTVRYESIELTEQLLGERDDEDQEEDDSLPQDEASSSENAPLDLSYNLEMLGDVALQSPTTVSETPDEEGQDCQAESGEIYVIVERADGTNSQNEQILTAGGDLAPSSGVLMQIQPLEGVDGTHLHINSSEKILSHDRELCVQHVYMDTDVQDTAEAMGISICN